MNVHLVRSPEFSKETYLNVCNLLQQFQGPIKFNSSKEDIEVDLYEEELRIWKKREDFEKKELSRSIINTNVEKKIIFPFYEKVKTWDQLFGICKDYRLKHQIKEEDIIVLLTDVANDKNWFGGVAPSMKDYFIHTANWEYFFGNDIDIRFPIAYEIIVWVMRYFMFPDRDAVFQGVHKTPIGCIMDFCEDKSQIILKMRTADACESCMNKFQDRDISPLYSRQFFDILDGIRNSMTFRGRANLLQQPSRIEIRGYTKKIFFKDLGGLELVLNPKEKTIFFFFLKHEEGISLSHLIDYRDELEQLYRQFSNLSEEEQIKRAIDILINPLENDINVVLSRINRKIKNAVGDSLYNFYCIKGDRGDKKRISLDREMVEYFK